MLLRIKVTTPPGKAKSADKMLRPFILGVKKIELIKHKVTNDFFIWEAEVEAKRYVKIIKNVSRYQSLVDMLLKDGKLLRKTLRVVATPETLEELYHLMREGTQVQVLRGETSTDA